MIHTIYYIRIYHTIPCICFFTLLIKIAAAFEVKYSEKFRLESELYCIPVVDFVLILMVIMERILLLVKLQLLMMVLLLV